jgi:hypothetical protein
MTRPCTLVVRSVLLLALLAFNCATCLAQSVGTAFTYQGRLEQTGAPYTGSADLRFQLFKGATAVGAPIERSAVQVTDGLFTTVLDFGQDINTYDSFVSGQPSIAQPSVEVAVRTPAGGPGTFTTLTPRQSINPAPLASGIVGLVRQGTVVVNQSNSAENSTFQINAEVIQIVTPDGGGDVDSIGLRLVNTAANPQTVALQLRQGTSTIIANSTAVAPVGTNFVLFRFPRGTIVSGTAVLRLVINTTSTLGVRYSSTNPYPGGDANFFTGADLVFFVQYRSEGSFITGLPLQISTSSTERLLTLTGNSPTGYTTITFENSSAGGGLFQLRSTGVGASEGPGRFRIRSFTALNPAAGLTVNSDGDVGVNVTTPLSRLHVEGDLRVSGGGSIIIPPTVRTLSIPAFAFHTQNSSSGVTNQTNGSLAGSVANGTVLLHAPLNLPDGCFITSFTLHAIDNATSNMSAQILATPKASSILVSRATTTTGGASTVIQNPSVTAAPAGVDNDADMFSVRVTWQTPAANFSDLSFRGVTIQYQISAPLP